jgi:hypothetical protein
VAAMFPERVERIVLDGNLNPHLYQTGTYTYFLDDVDSAFDGFVNTCFNVTNDCALYTLVRPKSPQDLVDAINALLAPLAKNATSSLTAYLTYAEKKNILYDVG